MIDGIFRWSVGSIIFIILLTGCASAAAARRTGSGGSAPDRGPAELGTRAGIGGEVGGKKNGATGAENARAETGGPVSGRSPSEDGSSGVPSGTENAHTLPDGVEFQEERVPDLGLAPGVGLIAFETRAQPENLTAQLSAQERQDITESFRRAYIEGILRGLGLNGVLGGDRVYGWPPQSPAAWVQNWRAREPFPNSWGLPSLILSLRSMDGREVYTVSGAILDRYGKIRGVGKPNGIGGYGAPRGNPFFYKGFIAQWFDLGLFLVRPSGEALFIPLGETAILSVKQITLPPESEEGVPKEGGDEAARTMQIEETLTAVFPEERPQGWSLMSVAGDEAVMDAFQRAWLEVARRTVGEAEAFIPDNPVYPVDLGEHPWYLATGNHSIPVRRLYIQSFNGGREALILAESPGLPLRARFVGPPFLDVLKGGPGPARLAGAETLTADPWVIPPVPERWFRELLEGLAIYGIPLSDPVPRIIDGVITEAQRFSKGWMIHNYWY